MAASAAYNDEPSLELQAAVNTWTARIKRAKVVYKTRFEEKIRRQRGYVAGEAHDDGTPGLVRTNLIFSSIATVLPHVYAKNPDISVTMTDAVPENQYQVYKKFAATMERVLHNLLVEQGKLKRRMKSNVRSTMTTGVGWLKLVSQSDIDTDPYIAARMQDVQDNLRRITYLKDEIEDPQAENLEAKKLELQTQLEALQVKAEVRRAVGFVIDRILSEDIMILDESIKEFDYYVEAEAIAHGVWFTEEKYKEAFGKGAPSSGTKYWPDEAGGSFRTEGQGGPGMQDEGRPQCFYRVWEIWHRPSNTVYTVCEGAKDWCREPFVPAKQGKRWYPFFCLGFNLIDGRWWPLSDEDLLESLQDEYNTTRTNFAEHRKASIPVQVVRTGGELTPEDVKRIEQRKINQIIAIDGAGNRPISEDIADLAAPKIDPQVYDTSQIRSDIDIMSGSSEASRSSVTTPKTATEAEILQASLMSRTAERQDAIEDLIDEMANFAAEVALQELTPEEVMLIAGEDAVWPTLDKARIWRLFKIKVKSGSSGKPNQVREQEQWVKLLPLIQETMKQVSELRMQGQYDMAEASIELLRETLSRFDEYIDIDRFITPGAADGQEQQAQQMFQLTQQNQQLQEASQQLQAELATCQQQLTQAKQAEQAKIAQTIADGRLQEEKIRADAAASARDASNAKQLERDKINNEYSIQAKKLDDAYALEQKKLVDAFELEKLKVASAERLKALDAANKKVEEARRADAEQAKAGAQAAQQEGAESQAMAKMLDQIKASIAELKKSQKPGQGFKVIRGEDNRIAELRAV